MPHPGKRARLIALQAAQAKLDQAVKRMVDGAASREAINQVLRGSRTVALQIHGLKRKP